MPSFLLLLFLVQTSNAPLQNGSVTGVLLTTTGRPASGVRISAMVPPGSPTEIVSSSVMAGITETDADGRYRLEGIPPGRYYITAGRVDLPTYYPGVTQLSGAGIVLVAPGGDVAGVDFTLNDATVRPRVASSTLGYTIPLAFQVEGGGPVPFYQRGTYPVLRFIDVTANKAIEIGFADSKVVLPALPNVNGDEYRVTVADLRDGYAVKSITYGGADLERDTLRVPRIDSTTLTQSVIVDGQTLTRVTTNLSAMTASSTLTVVLTKTPTPQAGRRVAGKSTVVGDEIYISNTPGILYSDGTFEFLGVAPGLHNIIKMTGTAVSAAPVIVGDRDVDGVVLQPPRMLPSGIFSDPPLLPAGTAADSRVLPLMSIAGRVLDEASREPVGEGAVTITGYGSARRSFAITSDGAFKIPDLLPGAYRITINISGYAAATHAVSVGAEDLALDLIGKREPR